MSSAGAFFRASPRHMPRLRPTAWLHCTLLARQAMVQRCHLIHDRPHHMARRITYLLRRALGDLFLGPLGPVRRAGLAGAAQLAPVLRNSGSVVSRPATRNRVRSGENVPYPPRSILIILGPDRRPGKDHPTPYARTCATQELFHCAGARGLAVRRIRRASRGER